MATHPASQRAKQMRSDAIHSRQLSRQIRNQEQRYDAAREATRAWENAENVANGAIQEILNGYYLILHCFLQSVRFLIVRLFLIHCYRCQNCITRSLDFASENIENRNFMYALGLG